MPRAKCAVPDCRTIRDPAYAICSRHMLQLSDLFPDLFRELSQAREAVNVGRLHVHDYAKVVTRVGVTLRSAGDVA